MLDVRSSYAFQVDVGRTCTVRGTLNEKGAAQSFEERAQMEYELRCERNADATSK